MEVISKTELQAIVDRNYELAKKNFEQKKAMGLSTMKLEDELMFFVCFDLQRTYGLDFKGAIPE